MNILSAFPTRFVSAQDLHGQSVTCTIERVTVEDLDDDNGGTAKPVCYFTGMTKGLVLNKTNAMTIAAAYGNETDAWRGRQVVVYPTETDFRGKLTACIRVRVPLGTVNGVPQPAPAQPPAQLPPPQQPTPPGADAGGIRF